MILRNIEKSTSVDFFCIALVTSTQEFIGLWIAGKEFWCTHGFGFETMFACASWSISVEGFCWRERIALSTDVEETSSILKLTKD